MLHDDRPNPKRRLLVLPPVVKAPVMPQMAYPAEQLELPMQTASSSTGPPLINLALAEQVM